MPERSGLLLFRDGVDPMLSCMSGDSLNTFLSQESMFGKDQDDIYYDARSQGSLGVSLSKTPLRKSVHGVADKDINGWDTGMLCTPCSGNGYNSMSDWSDGNVSAKREDADRNVGGFVSFVIDSGRITSCTSDSGNKVRTRDFRCKKILNFDDIDDEPCGVVTVVKKGFSDKEKKATKKRSSLKKKSNNILKKISLDDHYTEQEITMDCCVSGNMINKENMFMENRSHKTAKDNQEYIKFIQELDKDPPSTQMEDDEIYIPSDTRHAVEDDDMEFYVSDKEFLNLLEEYNLHREIEIENSQVHNASVQKDTPDLSNEHPDLYPFSHSGIITIKLQFEKHFNLLLRQFILTCRFGSGSDLTLLSFTMLLDLKRKYEKSLHLLGKHILNGVSSHKSVLLSGYSSGLSFLPFYAKGMERLDMIVPLYNTLRGQRNRDIMWCEKDRNMDNIIFPLSERIILFICENFKDCFEDRDDPLLVRESKVIKSKFCDAEDKLLLFGIRKFGTTRWDEIAKFYIPSKTSIQLENRYNNLISRTSKPNPVKDYYFEQVLPLSASEEELLNFGIRKYNRDFESISYNLLPHRSPQYIRRFWLDRSFPNK